MIRFRPHHFFCTLGFQGKGYSEKFVENYKKIADELRETGAVGDETVIQVVSGSDSICEPCPNREGQACATEAKIQMLDGAHSRALSLKPGDRITWMEAKKRIAEKISVELHHEICAPCSWLTHGICEDALKSLKKEQAS